jgi:hypothetical protein
VLEGCSPELAGRPQEPTGNGRPRWMAATGDLLAGHRIRRTGRLVRHPCSSRRARSKALLIRAGPRVRRSPWPRGPSSWRRDSMSRQHATITVASGLASAIVSFATVVGAGLLVRALLNPRRPSTRCGRPPAPIGPFIRPAPLPDGAERMSPPAISFPPTAPFHDVSDNAACGPVPGRQHRRFAGPTA